MIKGKRVRIYVKHQNSIEFHVEQDRITLRDPESWSMFELVYIGVCNKWSEHIKNAYRLDGFSALNLNHPEFTIEEARGIWNDLVEDGWLQGTPF